MLTRRANNCDRQSTGFVIVRGELAESTTKDFWQKNPRIENVKQFHLLASLRVAASDDFLLAFFYGKKRSLTIHVF